MKLLGRRGQTIEVNLGDYIHVSPWGGHDRHGVVIAFGYKDQYAVIDFRTDSGEEYWTYPEQIYRVDSKGQTK
jgi:hypothetical protein